MREILIVDDDRCVREGLAALLCGAGYAVRAAVNGDRALAEVSEHRPDLVLLDLMMPGRDGFETCAALRRLDRCLPVVILTAKDAEVDQVRGLEVGADDFVSKTASEAVLLARVRTVLDRAERRPSFDVPREMTKAEGDVYGLLRAHPGRIFSYLEIFAAIGGEGYCIDESTVRSHIRRLRLKLPAGETIFSRRNRGYGLTLCS